MNNKNLETSLQNLHRDEDPDKGENQMLSQMILQKRSTYPCHKRRYCIPLQQSYTCHFDRSLPLSFLNAQWVPWCLFLRPMIYETYAINRWSERLQELSKNADFEFVSRIENPIHRSVMDDCSFVICVPWEGFARHRHSSLPTCQMVTGPRTYFKEPNLYGTSNCFEILIERSSGGARVHDVNHALLDPDATSYSVVSNEESPGSFVLIG